MQARVLCNKASTIILLRQTSTLSTSRHATKLLPGLTGWAS